MVKVKRIDLSIEVSSKKALADPSKSIAWVIDDCLTHDFLDMVDEFRNSLPLDDKRPTVKRRFFSSAKQCPAIRQGLMEAIQNAITDTKPIKCSDLSPCLELHDETGKQSTLCIHKDGITNPNLPLQVQVLAYMRFLEYDQVGGHLDAHTDGNKVCEDTGLSSTHTMLLYLSDCHVGGETILFSPTTASKGSSSTRVVVEAVQPRLGRVLLFPHATWHEGAPTVDVPKLCLRAELALHSFAARE